MLRSLFPRPVYEENNEGGGGGAQMPEGLPAQFWDQQSAQVKMGEFIKGFGELNTFKTEHDARIAALPKTAEEYKFEIKLPDTVKVPDGVELKIDEKDPRFAPVRDFVFKRKLPQDALSELVALEAQFQIAAHAAGEAELQAEQKKLGENGPARVSAMESFLKANVSKEEYEGLRSVLGNASAFAGLEKLIAKATAQKIPPNDDPPRKDPPPTVRRADRFYGNGKAQ